jgi:shikimate kinase
MISATARCGGAATIVNAISTGKGAAFGIDLETRAIVELRDTDSVTALLDNGEDGTLVETAVKKVLELFDYEKGAVIKTDSTIPIAKGLKSSSAAANAAVLATFGALAKKYGRIKAIRLSKLVSRQQIEIGGEQVQDELILKLSVEAAKEAGVTVTGALDDAAASFYGGFAVTDNGLGKIMRKGELEDMPVVLFVPDEKTYTADVDVQKTKTFYRELEMLWDTALKGDLYTAMTLNGMVYSAALGANQEIANAAMQAGALAAGLSGTGPAVAVLIKKDGDPDKVLSALGAFDGKTILTRVNNQKAKIVE